MSKVISVASLNNESDEHYTFNAQATLATSSATSIGIGSSASYEIFLFDFSLSIEDCEQEEGRIRRRLGMISATD